MLITDSQVHIWKAEAPARTWPDDHITPEKPNGWTAEQMLAEMDAAGVNRAVIVPPVWCGDSLANEHAFEACDRFPGRFAVMARFDQHAASARDRLRNYLTQPHVLGIRLSGWSMPELLPPDSEYGWFWDACDQQGIPLMILIGARVAELEPIVERHPNLTIIIDHIAALLRQRGPAAFDNLPDLLALAAHPNVHIKTTSVAAMSAEPYPYADLQAVIRKAYDAFGPRRILWGANYTLGDVPYTNALGHVRDGLDFIAEEDKGWVLGKNASVLLNWPEEKASP